jgi:Chaperone of endosialidase
MAAVIPDIVGDAWGTTPATSNVNMNGKAITGASTIDASGQIAGGSLLANGNVKISSDAWGARVLTTNTGNLGLGTAGLSNSIIIGATGKVGIKKDAVADFDVNGSVASTSVSTGTVTATGNVSCSEVSTSSNANISGSAYITGDAVVSGNFEATNIQSGLSGSVLTFNKRTGALGGNTVNGTNLGRIDFNGWNTSQKTGAQILARQEGTGGTGVPTGLGFYTSDGTNVVERIRILKDGNVGIGTATPRTTLQALGVITSGTSGNANRNTYMLYNPTFSVGEIGAAEYGVADQPLIACRFGATAAPLIVGDANSSAYKLRVVGDASKTASGSWSAESDARIKKNIVDADLDICYDNIKSLRLRHFEWDDNYLDQFATSDRHVIGFIAQEVIDKFPKAVKVEPNHQFTVHKLDQSGNPIKDEDNREVVEYKYLENFMSLDADQILKTNVGATQLLMKKVEALEAAVAELQARLK